MKCLAIPLAFLCVASPLASGLAFAQTAGAAGIEGRVLDSDGNPLANAVVEFDVVLDQSGDHSIIAAATDANGFYSFEAGATAAPFGVSFYARCNTTKGLVQVQQPMYWTLRDGTVYHRDFRLTLPKKAKGCQL